MSSYNREDDIHREAQRMLAILWREDERSGNKDRQQQQSFSDEAIPQSIDEWKAKAAKHCLSRYFDQFANKFGYCVNRSGGHQFFSLQSLQEFEKQVIGPRAKLKHKKYVSFIRECTSFKYYTSVFSDELAINKVSRITSTLPQRKSSFVSPWAVLQLPPLPTDTYIEDADRDDIGSVDVDHDGINNYNNCNVGIFYDNNQHVCLIL